MAIHIRQNYSTGLQQTLVIKIITTTVCVLCCRELFRGHCTEDTANPIYMSMIWQHVACQGSSRQCNGNIIYRQSGECPLVAYFSFTICHMAYAETLKMKRRKKKNKRKGKNPFSAHTHAAQTAQDRHCPWLPPSTAGMGKSTFAQ